MSDFGDHVEAERVGNGLAILLDKAGFLEVDPPGENFGGLVLLFFEDDLFAELEAALLVVVLLKAAKIFDLY